MPRIIQNTASDACSLEECTAALDESGFDPADEQSLLHAAGWLGRLGRNRDFLGDMLVDRLADRHGPDPIENAYGPQAIVLTGMHQGYFLRANIWPAESDHCYRASGGRSFVYGAPHDHNFDFLTVGYFGPGYVSDYYEYDYEAVAGYDGEAAGLRFVERSALPEGRLMHYRAHRDVHSQLPPESLSVSLNIMAASPVSGWFDQYRFDLDAGEVTQVLNPGSSEVFLRMAVALGGDEALNLADHLGRSHPSSRLRLASFEARSMMEPDPAARDAVWREAELSGDRMLQAEAKRRRAALEIA